MNSSKPSTQSGTKFGQHMVDQQPRYETVYSRKSQIYRPTKRKKKPRYL